MTTSATIERKSNGREGQHAEFIRLAERYCQTRERNDAQWGEHAEAKAEFGDDHWTADLTRGKARQAFELFGAAEQELLGFVLHATGRDRAEPRFKHILPESLPPAMYVSGGFFASLARTDKEEWSLTVGRGADDLFGDIDAGRS